MLTSNSSRRFVSITLSPLIEETEAGEVITDACASHGGEKVHKAALLLLERFIGKMQLIDMDVLLSTIDRGEDYHEGKMNTASECAANESLNHAAPKSLKSFFVFQEPYIPNRPARISTARMRCALPPSLLVRTRSQFRPQEICTAPRSVTYLFASKMQY